MGKAGKRGGGGRGGGVREKGGRGVVGWADAALPIILKMDRCLQESSTTIKCAGAGRGGDEEAKIAVRVH